jgi:hypothetical protein
MSRSRVYWRTFDCNSHVNLMSTRAPGRLSQSYLAELQAHIACITAYHAGHDLPRESALSASVLPPDAYWTVREKNTFFRALRTHSRLRPDLIAQKIGSKTLVDVLALITRLEDSSLHVERRTMDWSSMAQAVEVSNDWVREESKLSEAITEAQTRWESSMAAAKSASQDDVETFTWPITMSSLGKYQLQALDTILRNQEDQGAVQYEQGAHDNEADIAQAGVSTHEQPMPAPSTPTHAFQQVSPVTDDNFSIDPALLSPSKNSRPSMFNLSQPTWHPLPPLASSSQPQLQHIETLSTSPPHSQQVDELQSHPHSTHPLPDISLAFAHDPVSLPSIPLTIEQLPGDELPEEAVNEAENLNKLSPRSWRRYQKRLHMRRKRASLRGEDASTHLGRLKPGPKQKGDLHSDPSLLLPTSPVPSRKRKRSANREDHNDLDRGSSQASEAASRSSQDEDDFEHEPEGKRRKSNVPGRKGASKARSAFAATGVDAGFLHAHGLDLFHYVTLSRLSRYVRSHIFGLHTNGYGLQ